MVRRILVVDDDPPTADFLCAALEASDNKPTAVTSASEAIDRLGRESYDAMLTDLAMPDMGGIDLCARALELQPRLPIIVVTGRSDLDSAVAALRAGAYDFVSKPVDVRLLLLRVDRALNHRRISQEVTRLREELARAEVTGPILGRSRPMKEVLDLIARVGPSSAPVLVLGESGTGKELAARAIHDASPRAGQPFIALNCAAVPATLIESELFGHVKGAFTDATTTNPGVFLAANGGTLFLDEIGELPIDMQPKLLRALQEQRVRPVGGSSEIPFDARIIAATNVDLDARVAEGRFREDLLYRIDVVRVDMPPLRDRGHDILLLAQHFLDAHRVDTPCTLSEEAAARLLAYSWPGNVRELENSIHRAVALAHGTRIVADDLPEKITASRGDETAMTFDAPEALVTLDELVTKYIARVMEIVGGNKSRAARILGLDRRSLYRRLDKRSAEPSPIVGADQP